MTTAISISELKTSPRAAISASEDYPLAIKNRNKTEAYIISKNLFEKIISFIEDDIDEKAVKEANYKSGTTLNALIEELGLE